MKIRMTVLSRLAVLLACLVLGNSVRATGTATVPEQRKLAELVRLLGDDNFRARERASRQLFLIGLPAKEILLTGSKDADPEVRRRCRDLLPEILEADRQAKLAAFIADSEGRGKHDLPGWERYRKLAGNDAASRKLFIEIQKSDTGFLRDVEKDPDRAGQQCANLCQELFQRQFGGVRVGNRQVTLAEIAPLLLVAADPKVRIPDQQRYLAFNLLYQPAAQTLLRNRTTSPFKKIVLAWMERQTDDETAMQQVFQLVNQLEIKEGLDLALKAIRDKKLKGMMLASAMTTVGKFGERKHLAVLEPFLKDKTLIGNFNLGNIRGTTQVRDAALAMMVRVTKQSHKQYGFAASQFNNDHLLAYANFLGFGSDEQRDKAFKKWKDWNATQKK